MSNLNSISLQKQSSYLFAGRITAFAINFFLPIILVRIFSTNEYGLYQQYNLLITTIVPIFSMWLNSSLFYFYPINDVKTKRYYILNVFAIELILWVLLIIIVLTFGEVLFSLLNLTYFYKYAELFLFTILFLLFSSISDYIFILEKKIKFNLFFFPLDRAFKLCLFISASYFYNILGLVYAYLGYSLIRFVFIIIYMDSYFKLDKIKKTLEITPQFLKYAVPFGMGLIVQIFAQRIDKYILNIYVEPSEFAIYSVAFFSIPILGEIFRSINNTAMPRLAEYSNIKDYANMINLWHTIIKKTSSITIPIVFYFIVMAPEIITLFFTSKYQDAIIYYRIYSLIFLFGMTSYGMILRTMNKTNLVFISNFLSFVIVFILSILLIPKFLSIGAIICALIAWALPVIFQLIFESRLLELSLKTILPWKTILQVTIISIISITIILPLKYYFQNIIVSISLSFILFFSVTVFIQDKYKLFIFPDVIHILKKRISNK